MLLAESRKSHGSTFLGREEDFTFYAVFEDGLVICIYNPVSVRFSVNVKSTVKGIGFLRYNFPRHAQWKVQDLRLALIFLKEEGL